MAEKFDPYLQWLGIRDPQRPPNHYRLLGLEPFETDGDVILNAADRQMAHIRNFQAGKNSNWSQRILNELSAAKICLLNAQRKAAYDAQLKQTLKPAPPVAAQAAAPSAAAPQVEVFPSAAPMFQIDTQAPVAPAQGNSTLLAVIGGGVLVALMVGGFLWMNRSSGSTTGPVAQNPPVENPPVNNSTGKFPTIPLDVPPDTKKEDPEPPPPTKNPDDEPKPEAKPKAMLWEKLQPSGTVHSVALSNSGTIAVVAGADPVLRVWNILENRLEHELSDHTDDIVQLAYHEPSGIAATASLDGSIILWDIKAGEKRHAMPAHLGGTTCLIFSQNGKQLASAGKDGAIRIWDVSSGESLQELDDNKGDLAAIAFRPKTNQLAIMTQSGRLRMWSLDRRSPNTLFKDRSGTHSIAFSPSGDRLLFSLKDGQVNVINLNDMNEEEPFVGHSSSVTSLMFAAGGQRLLTGSRDGTMKLWEPETRELLATFAMPEASAVTSVSLPFTARLALSGDSSGHVRLWRLPNAPEITEPDPSIPQRPEPGLVRNYAAQGSDIRGVAISPDEKRVAAACGDGSVRVFYLESGELDKSLGNHLGGATAVAFVPGNEQLLSGSQDGKLKQWDLAAGTVKNTWNGFGSPIATIRAVAEGPVVSSDQDGRAVLWSLASSEPQAVYTSAPAGDHWALFPESNLALSAGFDRTIRRWSLEPSANLQARWRVPNAWYSAIILDAEGKRALTGTSAGVVQLWNVEDGSEQRRMAGHTGPVWALAFHPDGKQALSGGHDGQVIVWDLDSGQAAATFKEHQAPVTSVAVAPSGWYALSGDRAGVLSLTALPVAETREVDPNTNPGDRRLPLPEKDLIALTETKFKETYKTELAKRSPEEKSTFAATLLEESELTKDSTVRYVILSQARDLAVAAGNAKFAFMAAQKLEDSFQFDGLESRLTLLTDVLRLLRLPQDHRMLVEEALRLNEAAIGRDNYDLASRFSSLAIRASAKCDLPSLVAYAAFRDRQTKLVKNDFDKLAKSLERWREEPADAEANLQLGKFCCITQGDWKRGLPMLALSGDATLSKLAMQELAMPSPQFPAGAMIWRELGRRWSDQSASESKPVLKTAIQLHAYECYYQSLAGLVDLERELSKKQLQALSTGFAKLAGQYLSTLPVDGAKVGYGNLGIKGNLGYTTPTGQSRIIIKGQPSPNGISTYPPEADSAFVSYGLYGQFQSLEGFVGIADTASNSEADNSLYFSIHGDGNKLWQSGPIRNRSQTQPFLVDVTGVQRLQISVSCEGNNGACQAVWIEPRLWPVKLAAP